MNPLNICNVPAGDEAEEDKWYPYHDNDCKGVVTTHYECQTADATHLCVYSIDTKLTEGSADDNFSIGGTYNGNKQELWFFCNVSQCHGDNYLLKLFVVFRKVCKIGLSLPSNQHDISGGIVVRNSTNKCSLITGPISQYRYTSSKINEVAFVRTFCITKDDLLQLNGYPLLVPCAIEIFDSKSINPNIFRRIKLEYTVKINEALYNARESEGDFVIESATHKKYPIHLFIAAAHSQVLRDVIKENKKTYLVNMSDEDVELLVGFLYKGSVGNLNPKQVFKLIELADMLMMPGLLKLGEKILTLSLNVDNAVHTAILAKKYNVPTLSQAAFHFIKHNPGVLSSRTIQNLKDIDLMKSMLQHIGTPCQCDKQYNAEMAEYDMDLD